MGRVEGCERVGGVWWEGWRSVVGVGGSVGEIDDCGGKGGGVWWEGWRCVGMSEVCGRDGGVWEGWRCVGVVKCGGRGGGV